MDYFMIPGRGKILQDRIYKRDYWHMQLVQEVFRDVVRGVGRWIECGS